MLTRSHYIEWITQRYPLARYNLAASGIPPLSPEETLAIPTYTRTDAYNLLCAAIADVHNVNVKEVLACNGASQAMWLAYVALLRPGDEVLIERPTYEPFAQTALALGVSIRHFDREQRDNFAINSDKVCRAVSSRTRVIALTNLHNPSGVRAKKSAISEIAERMRTQGGYVLIDEVYAPFDTTADPSGISCRTSRRLAPNIVAVSSLSKGFGLGQHRIGWVIGPPDVVERARVALRASTGDLSPVWANFALGAMRQLPALSTRAERLLGRKRQRVEQWINKRPKLRWSSPSDGLFGLVTVRRATDLRPIIERGLEERGVIVAPGSFFGTPAAFRLAWALPEACLDDALQSLDAVLSEAHLT